MQPTIRLLARYLEAGTPTGLTGLWTHSTPRSTLLYLYGTTLARLQNVPEASLYRQSVEAVTKHRLALVEAQVPPGYEEWAVKARKLVGESADKFRVTSGRIEGIAGREPAFGLDAIWIEPELKKDRSPFFKELENELGDGWIPSLDMAPPGTRRKRIATPSSL
jgi:hypothetical protein